MADHSWIVDIIRRELNSCDSLEDLMRTRSLIQAELVGHTCRLLKEKRYDKIYSDEKEA